MIQYGKISQNFYHCAEFPGESGQWICGGLWRRGDGYAGDISIERMESFHIPNLAKNGNCKPASLLNSCRAGREAAGSITLN